MVTPCIYCGHPAQAIDHTRHGYSVRTLSEQFNAKLAEIKRLMRGDLDAARTRELADEMRAAGLPL